MAYAANIESYRDYVVNLQQQLVCLAQQDLLHFTSATFPTFAPAAFHKVYYQALTDFARGDIKKLMVFMPPQHGKSEGSTRRLPAYLLGQNPDARIAIVSYNAPKARKFSREIQRIIDSDDYRMIFPDTQLSGKNVTTLAKGNWLRNADECEIVGHRGGFKTVGVGGALTGEPVDILILDDVYKDAKTAWSPIIRSSIEDWYDTVAETRLHNDSQQLIVFTRWHEQDLAGRLLEKDGKFDAELNPDGWRVLTFQAIKEGAATEQDERREGEALWECKHSLHNLQKIREKNPHVFQSLYQQNPKPAEGLLYEHRFREYELLPATKKHIVKNYTDTADTGADYLCSIDYVETELGNYILSVLYTSRPMEYTEVAQATQMTKDKVEISNIESNNGGRSYARDVEKQMRLMGNATTLVHCFYQGQNKEVRIFSNAVQVMNLTFMPKGWERMFPEFCTAVTAYRKTGKNAHDDAVDALTGTVEKRQRTVTSNIGGLFF
jgi:predicted phage terminase large subunit-like protein